MKLRSILFTMFLVLTIIPLLALGVFSSTYYGGKIIGILENDLSVATRMQVESINQFLQERDNTISIISDYEFVHDLFTPPTAETEAFYRMEQNVVNSMLQTRISKNEYLVSASIIDLSYHVLASSAPVEENATSELGKVNPKYLDGVLHFTPVIESTTGGVTQPVIVIIKGIYEDEALLGYLVEEMNLTFFEKVRASVSLFNDGTVYIVDGAGHLITAGSSSESRHEYVTTTSERSDYARAWAERNPDAAQGILRYTVYGQRYISYYSGIPNSDWTIISSMNVDEILLAPMDSLILLAAAFALLLVCCLVVNYLLTSRIARPLDDITSKFRRIKETQDYSIRMDEIKNSEIGAISTEINFLLSSVEEHLQLERQKQHRLREDASTDALTGLYNKRAMEELLCSAMDRARLQNTRLAVVYLDVDDFKEFNTEFGHSGGDKVLVFVADMLRAIFPTSCRVGGDEFVACVSEPQALSELDRDLKRLLSLLHGGVEIGGSSPAPVECSVGVAFWSGDDTCASLLDRADKAMYRVKNSTKNSFHIT